VAAVAAGLAAVLVCLAVYFADPDRPVKDIEARLGQGQAEELVGENALPRWQQAWCGYRVLALPHPGEPATLDVHEPTVVGLVRDPHRDSYRYEGEVRLDSDTEDAVGLCFFYQERAGAQGREVNFVALTFAPRVPGVSVSVNVDLYRLHPGRAPETVAGWRQTLGSKSGQGYSLAVEVRPEAVVAFWEGRPVCTLSRKELRAAAERFPEQEQAPETAPSALPPPVGLGLFVRNGAVSYQRVWVKPLD
jgi:hypothetical protein